jgi:lipopolysaccharide/colanic/teichoic acid biosynthesis glycosyltransferase
VLGILKEAMVDYQLAQQPVTYAYDAVTAANPHYLLARRCLDIVVAGLLLVLLSPLLALIALAIRLDSPGPILFRQKRVRGNWRPEMDEPEQRLFEFLKFRSMVANADPKIHQQHVSAYINGAGSKNGATYKMNNDPRVTRVGRFLRRTSIDELPQLLNVLRGDMTLVGPRPSLPYEVRQYRDWHRTRLTVVPGLTGLWQVSGRSRLSFEEMVKLDIEYVHRQSLLLDLWILLKTVPAVLEGGGAC